MQPLAGNLQKFYQHNHLVHLYNTEGTKKGTHIGNILFPLISKPLKFYQDNNI